VYDIDKTTLSTRKTLYNAVYAIYQYDNYYIILQC